MNYYKNISKKTLARIGVVCFLSVLLSSCLKDNNTPTYNPPVAYVTFIQASPDEAPLDFYLDQNRVNLNPVNYGDNIDYFRAYTGKRVAKFVNRTVNSPILTDTVTFAQDKAYSLFLANKPSSPEILLLTDSISRPTGTNASIRFVNLSPDAGTVDLVVQGGASIVTDKAYKGFTSFLPILGNKNYNLQVVQHGTSTVLATLANVGLNSSYVYTVWFHGLATGTTTTDKLALDIVTNAFY